MTKEEIFEKLQKEVKIRGSTYPKSCRLRLIFSYAGSPGFRSFLGLYFAGFSMETDSFLIVTSVFTVSS